MGSFFAGLNWLIIGVMEERSRWFLWTPVFFATGIAVYFGLKWQSGILSVGLSVLIAVLLLLPAIRNRHFLLLPVLASLLVSAGFNAGLLRQYSVEAPVLQRKTVTKLSGLVAEKSAGIKKVRLVLTDLAFEKQAIPVLLKIRLSVRSDTSHIQPGQRISLTAVLLPPPPPAYPGAYDFQRASYFKGIGAVGYSISSLTTTETSEGVWFRLKGLSSKLRESVNAYVARLASLETAGFSIAIMSGDKGALNAQQLDDMRQSGLAHLLAISGLHMGMVGGLIFFVVRLVASFWPRVALRYPIKKWAAIIALLGLTGYLAVSGMSVSALRSYLMISMIFIAICFDRTALSLRNLALAALVILIFLPESLLTASFQMSFAAVFCLISAYERYGIKLLSSAHRGGFIKRSVYYFAGILFTSLVASLATAPFAVYHFGQFAALGLIANLIAVPLMGLWVMPWTLVSFLFMPFVESSIPLDLAGAGIDVILKIAHFVSSLPGAILQVRAFPSAFLIGLIFTTLWFLIWRNQLKWGAIIIFVGSLPSLYLFSLPDILFSESGNLFLVRHSEGTISVSSKRADRFERKRWERLFGVPEFQKITPSSAKDTAIKCDPVGCVYRRKSHTIAFANNWMASELDCERATILFSAEPVNSPCSYPDHVIDKFDLWRSGTHALYFKNDGSIRLETVNSLRGDRPWVPLRYRKILKE